MTYESQLRAVAGSRLFGALVTTDQVRPQPSAPTGRPSGRDTNPARLNGTELWTTGPSTLGPGGFCARPQRRAHRECADSARPNVGCLKPLLALLNVEFDFLALGEGPVTGHLDRRVVDEHVHAIGLRDEAVALLAVEPLHYSGRHCGVPLCLRMQMKRELRPQIPSVERPRCEAVTRSPGHCPTSRQPHVTTRSGCSRPTK